ncbi:MAG: hypothetical protein GC138_02200 [Gammaproteobacteria bacterium]|nr:hypothetical protein [Gammaproteobacteria bacterium]
MALKSTIFKAELQIADMDRHYYRNHSLTIARHPSETDERMMVRLLAFALKAHDDLIFGKGLSTEDEPALWRKDLTGVIEQWIEVGQPDEKTLRKACGRASEVLVYAYGGRVTDIWWRQNRDGLERLGNLSIFDLPDTHSLAALAQRTMALRCTIQDGAVSLSDGTRHVGIEPIILKTATR